MQQGDETRRRPEPPQVSPEEAEKIAAATRERLEVLLEMIGIPVTAEIVPSPEKNFPLSVNITGEDLGILIGRRGQTLAALQYLAQLMQAQQSGAWYPISIDIAGYKKRRYEALYELAMHLAEKVRTTRRAASLEPMPADERRIVHIALANDPEVTTQSMNDGEARKVVIFLRKTDVPTGS